MKSIITQLVLFFCFVSGALHGSGGPNGGNSISLTPFDTLCVSGDPYVLDHATPSGGTWSGEGVANNIFDPTATGSFELTYTVNDSMGNPITASQQITVVDEPEVIVISGDPTSMCALDPLIYQAIPGSGVWGGLADENGVVDRSCAARPTGGAVAYELNAVNGGYCTWSTGTEFDLLYCNYIDLGPDQLICDNADTLVVILSFSWNGYGQLSGDVDLVEATEEWFFTTGYFYPGKPAGEYFFYGSGNGPGSCTGYDTMMVTVVASPIVELEMENSFNLSDPPIVLYGGSPGGGYYLLDDSIAITVLDPSMLGISSHTLHYYYVDPLTGCTGEASINIDIGTVGIENLVHGSPIQLIPNPAMGQLQIYHGSQAAHITLRDITGRSVGSWRTSSSPYTLDLSGYARGRYTITIDNDRSRSTEVLVVQ
ncbi:MAG: T9SS type A sorting domain-containing protein [Bacteroidota bacterium]|nr:T9SS type A sorting domain-containing protein [Bacteroidota bacterium]